MGIQGLIPTEIGWSQGRGNTRQGLDKDFDLGILISDPIVSGLFLSLTLRFSQFLRRLL